MWLVSLFTLGFGFLLGSRLRFGHRLVGLFRCSFGELKFPCSLEQTFSNPHSFVGVVVVQAVNVVGNVLTSQRSGTGRLLCCDGKKAPAALLICNSQ